jgi:mannose-6-phosphate isomerase-like protein (cupin superfamily)
MHVAAGKAQPIALGEGEGEALWFLGVLATIKAGGKATEGRFAVIENLAPKGHGAPLHVHTREDEWFYIMEGELAFWVGGRRIEAQAGAFVYGPRGIPHTFMVTSAQARFLVGVEPAGFEDFVRAVAEPARTRTLPPATITPPDPARLATIAAEYGIEILGPPGIPE